MERVLIALLLVGLALLLARLSNVLLLVLGAALVAVILSTIANPLRRRGVPPKLALLAAILLIAALLAGAGLLFGSSISGQVADLRQQLPAALAELRARVADTPLAEPLQALAGGGGSGFVGGIARFAVGFTTALTDLVLVIVAGIFLAAEPRLYRRGLLALVPNDQQDHVGAAVDASGEALRLWLLGQLFSMTVVGVATAIGLSLVGVPSALALGLFAGLAQFVPFVGPIVAAIPGLLVALAVGPEVALWALLVYVGIQQVESNFLTPLVVREMIDLPPALTLFAIFGMAALFGPLGLLLGTPLAVVLFVLVKLLWVRETLGHPTEVPGEDSG